MRSELAGHPARRLAGPDLFLVLIVAGVVLLVVAAFVVVLSRPEQTYVPDDAPEGVAQNYILALQKGEYERAYAYVSPDVRHRPTSASDMAAQVEDNSWSFQVNSNTTYGLNPARITGDQAVVTVTQREAYQGGLFSMGSAYTSSFDMRLKNQGGWKIVHSERLWRACWEWETSTGCSY